MGVLKFFKRVFGKEDTPEQSNHNQQVAEVQPVDNKESEYAGVQFYVLVDGDVVGPYSLADIKEKITLKEETLITTNTLEGEWYEAKYFDCFDDLINAQKGFHILEDGTIVIDSDN